MILTDDEGKPFVKPVRSDFRTDHEFTQAFHEYKRRIEGAQSSAVYHTRKKTPMKYETRGVLGGAYKATNPKSLLTHTIEIDESKPPAERDRVLCNRVDVDNIADPHAPGNKDAKPTCPVCAKRDPRFMTIWELNRFELRGTKINPAYREWQRRYKASSAAIDKAKKAYDKMIGSYTTADQVKQEDLYREWMRLRSLHDQLVKLAPPARIKK